MIASITSRSAFRVASQAAPRAICRNLITKTPRVQGSMPKNLFISSRQLYNKPTFHRPDVSFFERNKKELFMGGLGLVGITALCVKGVNDQQTSADATTRWPDYVSQRIKASYAYVLGGLGLTAATSTLFFRSGAVYVVMRANRWVFLGASLLGTIGTLMLTTSTPPEDRIMKHMAWASAMTVFGLTLSPLLILGGPILMRAAMMTGGVVGSLSLVAYNTPGDMFTGFDGALSMGLGLLIGSSLAGMFIPAYFTLAHNISLYGGLGLFSLFVLRDSQVMVERAKIRPKYDAINESIHLYLDTIQIFIRMAEILARSNRRR